VTVRHVLFDADGVIQTLPGGWVAAVEPFAGEGALAFLEDTWTEELPALRGQGDFLVEFARSVERHGIEVDVEEFYAAVWNSIEVSPQMVDLVHRVRAGGYGVHLGTNQEAHRAAYMRSTLGYDDLFDVSCYSCELGAAKPEGVFFRRALGLIGAQPDEVLFVDDNQSNVDGARAVGLVAERWDLDQGLSDLQDLLAAHDVKPG
jgi:putative hydrolase of the HAD superfamily